MNQTTNYQLSQWDGEDRILREDFNADNVKIDAALKAEAAARAALAAQVAKLGNCQIWTTTYRGTGTCGPASPTSLTFPKKPLLAVIDNGSGEMAIMMSRNGWFASPNGLNTLSWSGRTASWYTNDGQAYIQLNDQTVTYRVVALLAADQ